MDRRRLHDRRPRRGLALTAFALDHVVVAAPTLDAGAAWCERTFGVAPAPGGRHVWMGTHNRLLRIDSPAFPRAYLEVIAIDREAPAPSRRRWFDLDAAELQAAIADGPALVHWVARVDDLDAASAALRSFGFEVGPAVAAERATPRGRLSWRIAVRDDGARLAGGAVPLLIGWDDVHPCDDLPPSGVELERFAVGGLSPELASWLGVERLEDEPGRGESPRSALASSATASFALQAEWRAPSGPVVLRSPPAAPRRAMVDARAPAPPTA